MIGTVLQVGIGRQARTGARRGRTGQGHHGAEHRFVGGGGDCLGSMNTKLAILSMRRHVCAVCDAMDR